MYEEKDDKGRTYKYYNTQIQAVYTHSLQSHCTSLLRASWRPTHFRWCHSSHWSHMTMSSHVSGIRHSQNNFNCSLFCSWTNFDLYLSCGNWGILPWRKHCSKCFLIRSWLKNMVLMSSLRAAWYVCAIAKTPQSSLPSCCGKDGIFTGNTGVPFPPKLLFSLYNRARNVYYGGPNITWQPTRLELFLRKYCSYRLQTRIEV